MKYNQHGESVGRGVANSGEYVRFQAPLMFAK